MYDRQAREREIRKFLIDAGLKQHEVAERFGLTRSAVAMFVSGHRPNNQNTIKAFRKLGWTDDRNPDGSLVGGPPILRDRYGKKKTHAPVIGNAEEAAP